MELIYVIIIREIKRTVNAVCLNHPETMPLPQCMEKLSSMRLIPGAKNLGTATLRGFPSDSVRKNPPAM